MPKTRPPYPPEFRRRLLDLVRAGRTPESLSKEFKVSAQSIPTPARAGTVPASNSRTPCLLLAGSRRGARSVT